MLNQFAHKSSFEKHSSLDAKAACNNRHSLWDHTPDRSEHRANHVWPNRLRFPPLSSFVVDSAPIDPTISQHFVVAYIATTHSVYP